MKCQKCGSTIGKNGQCTNCQRKKTQRNKLVVGLGIAAVVLVAALVLALTLFGGENDEMFTTSGNGDEVLESNTSSTTAANLLGLHYVDLEIEGYGTISLELDANAAPITVENFLKLVESGFYNGLTFHRIMEGFMMQGGDPLGPGMGGSDQTITGEFSANGVENPLSHTRGTISMARSQDMNSASSQFFIVHQDSLFLDGQYACFGHVINGIEIVDAICEAAQPTDDNGTIPADAQPIIVEARVVG